MSSPDILLGFCSRPADILGRLFPLHTKYAELRGNVGKSELIKFSWNDDARGIRVGLIGGSREELQVFEHLFSRVEKTGQVGTAWLKCLAKEACKVLGAHKSVMRCWTLGWGAKRAV